MTTEQFYEIMQKAYKKACDNCEEQYDTYGKVSDYAATCKLLLGYVAEAAWETIKEDIPTIQMISATTSFIT